MENMTDRTGLAPGSDSDNRVLKARLRAISDLKIPGSVLLDDVNLAAYINNNLTRFVEGFPRYEEQIKSALENRDYRALSKILIDLCYRLKSIHANDLANDCQKQMEKLPDIRQEKIEAYIAYFLTAVSMLSIDIQMVVYKTKEAADEIEAAADLGEPESGGSSILAVDDEPFFLRTLETALQDIPSRFVGVTSGATALRYLQDHSPDIFILDIEMPEMDGYELAHKIREAKQNAPIVFLTGNSRKENVVKAIEIGAADFILKPIHKEQVIKRIGRFILGG